MQELKVATVNRVSYEQGDLQQWIRNYDDVSKDYSQPLSVSETSRVLSSIVK